MSGWWNVLWGVLIIAGLFALATGMIWIERRLLAFFQDRLGPNRVGPLGLLQPVADIIKLFMKEDWNPPFSDKWVFALASFLAVVTVLLAFVVVPVAPGVDVSNTNVGLLFLIGMMSLNVYSVVLAGWSSDSKYPLIGAMRGAAQMISYELPMALSLIGVVMLAGSFRLSDIVNAQSRLWYVFMQPLGMVLFFIAGVAESRRIPFDLPEAENEIVAGYHTEYSSMKFALFYLGEYLDLMLVSAMVALLFLGGWLGPGLPGVIWFLIKVGALIFIFIWLRAVLPRYRYDQLMEFGWKWMLPLSLLNLVVTGAIALSTR